MTAAEGSAVDLPAEANAMGDYAWEPIGRSISVMVLGNTDREHPIEDAIASAAHDAGKRYGFDVATASGPYYDGGDERDRKLAEVTAERDRLAGVLESHSRCRHHDGDCSGMAEANERFGVEVRRLREENARLREALTEAS